MTGKRPKKSPLVCYLFWMSLSKLSTLIDWENNQTNKQTQIRYLIYLAHWNVSCFGSVVYFLALVYKSQRKEWLWLNSLGPLICFPLNLKVRRPANVHATQVFSTCGFLQKPIEAKIGIKKRGKPITCKKYDVLTQWTSFYFFWHSRDTVKRCYTCWLHTRASSIM